MALSEKQHQEKPEILLVDAGALSVALVTELENAFEIEQVDPGQVSGTLLISNPKGVITPYVHVQEVARAIRGASSHAGLPCIALAPPADLSRLKERAPREVTAVIAEITAPSAISVRLGTLISQSQSKRARPKTLLGVGGALSSRPAPPSTPPDSTRTTTTPTRPPSVSPVVPEREWIRSSRPPEARTHADGSGQRAKSPSAPALPPLGALPEEVLSLRIAVIDDDVTRVDSIARALRLSGHTVFVAAATEKHVHWPLLRQFAPQAIVIQPDALSMERGVWKDTFAKDPFLRQTPLVEVDFSDLFNERTGHADTTELQWKFEGIGRAELDFQTELSARNSVEVDRAHVNPGRLVALLSELGRSVVVTCSTRAETMSWKIVGGLCGPATVIIHGKESTLTAKQALDRLLQRPQATIVVETRKGLSLQNGQDVFRLLEDAYNDYIPSPRVPVEPQKQSGTPEGRSDAGRANSEPPTGKTEVSTLPTVSNGDSEPPTTKADLSELPPDLLAKAGLAPAPVPRPSGADAPEREATTRVEIIGSDSSSTGPQGFNWKFLLLAALPVLAAVAYLVGRPDGNSEEKPAPRTPVASAQTPSPPSPPDQATDTAETPPAAGTTREDSTPITEDDPWRVRHATELSSCQALLGQEPNAYAGKPRWRADVAWKNARQRLLSGDREGAMKWMCEAAFMHPQGPAPAGLVGLYLGQRSLEQAHRWAKAGAQSAPSSKRSQELLGDVLSQMGEQEKAEELWLRSMGLERGSEKRTSVAAALEKSAEDALRGADGALAERLLRRAAFLAPDDANISGALARALWTGKEPELARLWAERAVRLDPKQDDALLTLGALAEAAGDREEARKHYGSVPKSSPLFRRAREQMKHL